MSNDDYNRKQSVQEDRKGRMASLDKTKKSTSVGRPNSPFTADGDLVWTVENEVLFLTSMIGHKPVGINRHFEMVCIVDNFQNALNRRVDPQVLWDRLDTMYNMDRLNKVERIPFPNEVVDFSLPEEYSPLIQAKQQDIDLKIEVTPPPEAVLESPKRELKRELQVYKGMKDIKRDANKEPTKEVAKLEQVPEVKETKKDEPETPEVPPQKKIHISTPPEKIDRRTKEYKLLEAVKQQILAKDKKSNPEKEAKVTPTIKPRNSTGKKEVKEEKIVELKKERVKELTPGSAKRSTRGSVTDSASNKSASPITTPVTKRKRTQP